VNFTIEASKYFVIDYEKPVDVQNTSEVIRINEKGEWIESHNDDIACSSASCIMLIVNVIGELVEELLQRDDLILAPHEEDDKKFHSEAGDTR
jgi:hypothetical protein